MSKQTNNINNNVRPEDWTPLNPPDLGTPLKERLAELEEREQFLKRWVHRKERSLARAPEGNLRRSGTKKKPMLYLVLPGDSPSKGTYVSQEDRALITTYVKKRYNEKCLSSLKRELTILTTLQNFLKKKAFDSVYYSLPEEFKSFVRPDCTLSKEDVSAWENVEYYHRPPRPGNKTYVTDRGEVVQSKTEMIIANYLYHHGIPYRYEYPIKVITYQHGFREVISYRPDFMILNTRTGKVYLLEHLGIIDRPDYATDALQRMRVYEQNGYILGEHILFTMETEKEPFDSEDFQRKCEKYFI